MSATKPIYDPADDTSEYYVETEQSIIQPVVSVARRQVWAGLDLLEVCATLCNFAPRSHTRSAWRRAVQERRKEPQVYYQQYHC